MLGVNHLPIIRFMVVQHLNVASTDEIYSVDRVTRLFFNGNIVRCTKNNITYVQRTVCL